MDTKPRTAYNLLIMENVRIIKSNDGIVTLEGDAVTNPRMHGADRYTKATLTGEDEKDFSEYDNERLLMCIEMGLFDELLLDDESIRIKFEIIYPITVGVPVEMFIPRIINGYDIDETLTQQIIRKRLSNKRRKGRL